MEVQRITKEEVRATMKRMKSGKTAVPDNIPVDTWRCLEQKARDFLNRLFNTILERERERERGRLRNGEELYRY